MLGAHAAFTLSADTLEALGRAVEAAGAGFHVHAAEDAVDVRACRQRFGTSLPELFARHRLLGPRTLLAHGVHLTPGDLELVASHAAWVVHSPRSNMNNAVGHAALADQPRTVLGTDGVDQDMLAEARAAFLRMREARRSDAGPQALRMLAGGHRLAAELFGLAFGRLEAGAPADLVVLDYRPPTPLRADTLAGHLLFGTDRSHVRSVMVAGRWVVRDQRITGVDARAVFARAQDAAQALWQRMQRL
jgi:cytosine/adenosine deaminase-related metal-dependent hydrolase